MDQAMPEAVRLPDQSPTVPLAPLAPPSAAAARPAPARRDAGLPTGPAGGARSAPGCLFCRYRRS